MRKYTDKEIEKVSGAIASCFETLHYLEECKKLENIKSEAEERREMIKKFNDKNNLNGKRKKKKRVYRKK